MYSIRFISIDNLSANLTARKISQGKLTLVDLAAAVLRPKYSNNFLNLQRDVYLTLIITIVYCNKVEDKL